MKKTLESKLEAAEMRILRRSCGRTMMDRIPNGIFRNVLEMAPISAKVREGRLRRFGDVHRRLASAPGAVGGFNLFSVRAECIESVVTKFTLEVFTETAF
ncbi:hypothetical protein OROGR_017916 [Orobanche gracilis]